METKKPRFGDVPLPEDAAPQGLHRAASTRGRRGQRGRPKRVALPTSGGRALRRAALVAALVALPGVALGATVKGKIAGGAKLLNPVWNEAKDPNAHRYTFREPSPTVRPDVRNLSGHLPKELCIVALGEKGAPLKVPYRVSIAGGRTTPVTLVVAEGQQIQFENRDPFPHKLYETSNKGGFTAAEILPTKSRAWTPPGPGKYEFKDELAPSVRSWVVVEPKTVAFGYPDRKGDFAISLEPGTYKLRGYFMGEPVGKELEVNVGVADLPLANPLVVGEGDKASAPPTNPAATPPEPPKEGSGG